MVSAPQLNLLMGSALQKQWWVEISLSVCGVIPPLQPIRSNSKRLPLVVPNINVIRSSNKPILASMMVKTIESWLWGKCLNGLNARHCGSGIAREHWEGGWAIVPQLDRLVCTDRDESRWGKCRIHCGRNRGKSSDKPTMALNGPRGLAFRQGPNFDF